MLAFVICLPLLAPAQEQPKPLLFQAEAMTTVGDAWTVRQHIRNWYGGRPVEDMLDGSVGGLGQAVQELNVPEKGTWRLWVRYLDVTRARGQFRLTVLQDNKKCATKVFDQISLRADEAGRKKWGGGYAQFVWNFLDVPL